MGKSALDLIRAQVAADRGGPPPAPASRTPFVSFPVDNLPMAVRDLAARGAAAVGCDPALIATHALAALAGAVGNARSVRVKSDWVEPCCLWTLSIGPSSSRKSPGFDKAVAPLHAEQRRLFREHQEASRRHDQMADARETEADPPACRRVVLDDVTLDAVAPVLRDNPKGVLVAAEEADAFFQGLVRYAPRGANDRARWLKLYGGRALIVDRKTAAKAIYVPRALASITGTVQPHILARALGPDERAAGLAARFLLTCPPVPEERWSDDTVPDEVTAAYARLVGGLLSLRPGDHPDGGPDPVVLPLTPAARGQFAGFVRRNGRRMAASMDPDDQAVAGKVEGAAARLALVFELAAAEDDPAGAVAVGSEAMAAGIAVAEWYLAEAARVYALLAEPPGASAANELAAAVGRLGGTVTANELRASNTRRWRTNDQVEAELEVLAQAGLGSWEAVRPGPAGGRPTRVFRLTPPQLPEVAADAA